MRIDEKQEEIIGLTIEELQSKVKMLEEMNASLQLLQICLRDKVAMSLYTSSFIVNPLALNTERLSDESKAVEAFKKADAFIRVREQGQSYENELVEDLKELLKNKPNDQDLGKVVRQIYQNQK
jgi:hypothetical protein